MSSDLPASRDRPIEGRRDLEVQDALQPDVSLGDWRLTVADGARQRVVQSACRTRDWFNFGNNPRRGDRSSAAEATIDRVRADLHVSIRTRHAHYAHVATHVPPVHCIVTDAGTLLSHAHLQDADRSAGQDWPPGRGTANWQGVPDLRRAAGVPAAMTCLTCEDLAFQGADLGAVFRAAPAQGRSRPGRIPGAQAASGGRSPRRR